jgi:hypothetical protein
MGWTGRALLVVLAAIFSGGPTFAQQPPPPPVCSGAEHRQFDFWLGSWDVSRTGQSDVIAQSLIEKLYAGCAIRENWMPKRGGGGGSLNSYLPDRKMWRQTWVDSSNSYAVFEGGLRDGAMILTGKWKNALGSGTDPLVRIHWTREANGSVRQRGETSDDEGASWKPFFDLTYRPANSPN